MSGRVLRVLIRIVVVVAVLAALAGAMGWWWVGRSLPLLDGQLAIAGLGAPVTITRDDLGVPTIVATSRADAARALGFLHGQERFFQMDLSRRRAAGELSALVGAAALPTDRSARLHRFRARAGRVIAAAAPEDRAIMEAYAAGVNAGLGALAAPPFEYALLRQTPAPWTPEDSVLVVASMYFTLQDPVAAGEARAASLHAALPAPLATFLNSTASDWDTPQHGAALPAPVPPGPEVFDLRTAAAPPAARPPAPLADASLSAEPDEVTLGSNNWAVAGSRSATGRALVADDMHLALGAPNIWYRASMIWRDPLEHSPITGVTLPGLPSMVVGSNGFIAWGFTNTTADWSDRIVLDVTGEGPSQTYATPDGPKTFETFQEDIAVSGQPAERLEVRETIWGPVDGPDAQGRLHAIVWVPHFVEGLSLSYRAVEEATTLDGAMRAANLSGIPAQNIVIGDVLGQIAWTVAGRIPKRVGFDGSLPTSWADGTRKWDGWYAPEDYPRIVNPESGVIVTANNRIVSDQWLAMMGDGGYDPGARARQIQDLLLAQPKVSVEDSRRVHLDDRAILMERWRALAKITLRASESTPARAEFLDLLDSSWTARASIDSVGYRLARQFRSKVAELVWVPFVARVRPLAPNFPAVPGRALEGPVWALVTQRPMHLLDPKYQHWNALLLDAIDQTIATLTADGRSLRDRTWGEANTLSGTHPLSRAIPQLARWLDLPREPLPGDNHMPRFQSTTNGASERFTVSPGFEGEGYFHMPGGQSGNPRSPHYRDGHRAWVTGEATPFLPGKAVATLTLTPLPPG